MKVLEGEQPGGCRDKSATSGVNNDVAGSNAGAADAGVMDAKAKAARTQSEGVAARRPVKWAAERLPIIEWGDGHDEQGVVPAAVAESSDLEGIAEARRQSELIVRDFGDDARQLYEAENCFSTGRFEAACSLAEPLLASENGAVALAARCTLLTAHIASGNPSTAYDDLVDLRKRCEKGFECADDPLLRAMSIVCALRAEGIVMARIFDIPAIDGVLDDLPPALRVYAGFIIAQNAMRVGKTERAVGIAEAFLAIFGDCSRLASVLLHLAIASAEMISGDAVAAEKAFMHAWNTASDSGIITPFVELNYALLGLPRRCLVESDLAKRRRIDKMAKAFHRGWYGLRCKCGFPDGSMSFTPVESWIASLVVLGWRNKEIAAHLNMSVNTVKHQLTMVYQKANVSSRAELRKVWESGWLENEWK